MDTQSHIHTHTRTLWSVNTHCLSIRHKHSHVLVKIHHCVLPVYLHLHVVSRVDQMYCNQKLLTLNVIQQCVKQKCQNVFCLFTARICPVLVNVHVLFLKYTVYPIHVFGQILYSNVAFTTL